MIDEQAEQFGFVLLWLQFKKAYTNSNVQIWSIWYAVGMCGYLQVVSYIQVLWKTIDDSQVVGFCINLVWICIAFREIGMRMNISFCR